MIVFETKTGHRHEINPTKAGENYLTCPVCSPTRKKKRDRCFCWNADKQVGKCNHCGAVFAANENLKQRDKRQYVAPEWKNMTQLSDNAVKWFTGRMISQDTLRKMKIYSDVEYMPGQDREMNVICFPYFRDGELVNIKYRDGSKGFKMAKGAELIFYNFDAIRGNNEIIICEGEIDALTFIECGYDNVVSVPNGAGSTDLTYLDNYIDLFTHERIYVAADFDDAGLKLRNELTRRLGPERCRIVTYKGHKDANELFSKEFKSGIDEVIANAREIPIEGNIDLEDNYDNIYSMFANGLPKGFCMGVQEVDDLIRWQPGRLAIWTGIPSHGKSEMLDFLICRLNVEHGWKTLYFSPENYPIEYHFAKIAEKITGREFRKEYMKQEEFDEVFEYISNNFFWLEPYENATVGGILERAKIYVRRTGIRQLVIDPFNCLEHKMEYGEKETTYIGRFLDELSRFAKQMDVLVHLVAHPAKMERLGATYREPTLYDISGSAHFYNKADYGITIYRNFADNVTSFIPTKVRFRNLGKPDTGGVKLQYNLRNGRYETPKGDVYLLDNSNWLTKEAPHGSCIGFNNDDCPF